MKKLLAGLFLAIGIFVLVASIPNKIVDSQTNQFVIEHQLEYEFDTEISDNYYPYSTLRPLLTNSFNISNELNGKTILIETSLDLYNWSRDLRYQNTSLNHAKKQELLSQNYALGQDIDYSERKSSRFAPIGYSVENNILEFTGEFDGRGFEITNLYFVVFNEYYFIDETMQAKVPSNYFSMFSHVGSTGSIHNLGLINPIIDLENEHPDLKYYSYLVGENRGSVENVYVEDNRGIDKGGIKALASLVNEESRKSASGIVHTNYGTFEDSYYTGESVINVDYTNVFLERPILYSNITPGTYNRLVFDSSTYKSLTGSYSTGESNLKVSSSILSSDWAFYNEDGFPKLYKLQRNVDNQYEITSAADLIHFTKLITLRTVLNNKPFNESDYILTESINLNDVARGAYVTPRAEFKGSFKGKTTVVNGIEKYSQINNLYIDTGVLDGESIYYGLFSTYSGRFENIVFYNATIKPNPSQIEAFINSSYYIGFIAGKLNNATVKNIFINGSINLQNSKIGAYQVGAVAGEASGTIERVLFNTTSEIVVGTQTYLSQTMKESFYQGGIIGKTDASKLTMYNIMNEGSLTGLSASTTTNNAVNYYFGGIIGYVNNTAAVKHNFGLMTNKGSLSAFNITSTNSKTITYYLGGVIGYSGGSTYQFSNRYGKWNNQGSFDYTALDTTTAYIAGVINSDHTEAIEFVQLSNDNDLILNKSAFQVAAIINHIKNVNLTVSQVKSDGEYTLGMNKSVGLAINMINTNPILQLNYVEIYNDFTFTGSINTIEQNIAGVTLHEKTNYLNVTYGGDININVTSGNRELWVSGLSKVLSSGYYVKNGMNEGNINITYASSANLYVSGLINRNLSGDLHTQDSSTRPKATLGIINSINMADLDIEVSSNANSFVGGLSTLNGGSGGGSVQDAVNIGNILVRNSSTTSAASFSNDDNTGGLVESYSGGIIVGGVTSTITHGLSRIYDTSNKGEIIGISNKFVRSGGVLGSALLFEIQSTKSGINSAYYSTTNSGDNYISNAIVANGINYADVQAVTQTIIEYSTTNNTATAERIGVHAAAGGVIGYGLTQMKRMINHGNISSTDVAGGVVGATMAYTTSGNYIYVDINTAINYGSIRAIKTTSFETVYTNKKAVESNFYAINDTWITPSTIQRDELRRRPAQKRGFGGVFGRLQRARSQYMSASGTGNSFDFVVNMDKNVDLIGRLDQVLNYTSSLNYFIFINAKYYSAKPNDNTQTVFVGEYRSGSGTTITIRNSYLQGLYTYYREGSFWRYTYYKDFSGTVISGESVTITDTLTLHQGNQTKTETFTQVVNNPVNYNITSNRISSTQSEYNNEPQPYQNSTLVSSLVLNGVTNVTLPMTKEVPTVTEVESEAVGNVKYVYDDDFEMRLDSTILDNGESITSYIYYAEKALLAEDFQESRPNGMYVLSSSSGSKFGAVIPKNFSITKLKKIQMNVPNNLNYNDVNSSYLYPDNNPSYIALMHAYESLYQTSLNDKSALLENEQRLHMKDNNFNTEAFFYAASFTGNEITFVVNRDFINNNTTFTFNFELMDAIIPEGALIAKTGASQADLLRFRTDNPTAKIAINTNPDPEGLDYNLAPNLSYPVPNRTNILGQTITLGTFTSYSQAAIFDNNFTGTYKTDYTVKLQILNTTISDPTLYRRSIDGGAWTTTLTGTPQITQSIGLEFREANATLAQHKLQNGFLIDEFIKLYYADETDDIEVDPTYYTITSIPKAGRDFSTTISLSTDLRNGTYRVGYKFYETDTEELVNISFNPLRTYDFTEFKPYSSTTYDGTTANLRFDYDLFGLHMQNGEYFQRTINNEGIPIYLDGYYVYDIYFLEDFVKTAFFEFDSIVVVTTTSNGYITHEIQFRLGTTTVTTKYIQENKLSPNYYKDNVTLVKTYDAALGIDVATTDAKREAQNTIFTLDYNLPTEFYDASDFTITYTYNGVTYPITNASAFIYYDISGRLNLMMTKEANPGIYTINVIYLRGSTQINAGKLTVTKLSGTSGYLTNIKFSRFVIGSEYPDIGVTNSTNSTIDDNYLTNVYYNGIDYADADTDNKTYFRIDGEVAKIPLNNYMPVNITNYLPDGAMIKRKYYDEFGVAHWTDPVNNQSSLVEIEASLSTDFTLDPLTGQMPLDESKVYIEYMVVPEVQLGVSIDDQQGITYFISVTDINYTFLAVFNYWYRDTNGIRRIEDESSFNNQIIFLTINNYEVSYLGEILTNSAVINIDGFDDIQFDKIENTLSRANMFYYVNSETSDNYIYQIGSNLSGYYQFKVDLPKGYKYTIYLQDYANETNILMPFSTKIENIDGVFYYINTSSIMRTRYFQVVIEADQVQDGSWGFTDNTNP